MTRRRNDIGVVLDEVGFPAQLNARQLDRIFSDTYARWDSERFFALLRQFGIPDDKPFQSYSRGMKMKAGIASALAHDAKLLILDEATSNIDTRSEKLIHEGLKSLMGERTVLVIAHRLSTIKDAQEILVLEEGRIIERGSQEELLKKKGAYYDLYTGRRELA